MIENEHMGDPGGNRITNTLPLQRTREPTEAMLRRISMFLVLIMQDVDAASYTCLYEAN